MVSDNCIYIIGGIGYNSPKDGVKKDTPVFKLDLSTFEISKVDCFGVNPGWIHHHDAMLKRNKIWVLLDGNRKKEFYLDLETRTWGKKILKKENN